MAEKKINNRLQIIENYLCGKNINLETLKIIINEDSNSNILKNIFNVYSSYINKIEIEKINNSFLKNIQNFIIEIIKSNDIKGIDYYLGKIRKIKKAIINKEEKIKTQINNETESHLKEALYNAEIIEKEIIKRIKTEYKDNNFEFLSYIINDIQNKKYLDFILSLYPYYINSKDDDNNHIIVSIIDIFLEEIVISNKNNINKILYYESIIEKFLRSSRFKLQPDEQRKIKQKIKNYIEELEKVKKFIKKYSQKYECLTSLYEKLNSSNFSKDNIESINKKYNITSGFSINVQKELETLNTNKSPIIITIDDDDTLDMDDAISIRKNEETYTLDIYISDVASTVKEKSFIDKEAYNRFSTIYLSDVTIPMLPFELSNNILSLNTDGIKNVITYEIEIDKYGNIVSYNISNRQITVTNNLSYRTVNQFLNKGSAPNERLYETIKNLNDISIILKNSNIKKVDYRQIEDLTKKVEGEKLDKTEYKNRTKSEIIIEECMILGNILPSKFCEENNLPYIYRVHPKIEDTKDYEALKELQNIVNNEYDTLSNENYLKVINTLIKMYPEAYYTKNNIGHFGLNLDVYSHSTSPIRRYADLINQRITHDLILQKPTDKKIKYWENKLDEICEHMNSLSKTIDSYTSDYEKIRRLEKKR